MPDAPLLEVRRVSKRFPGVRALHNVDLALQKGQVLALIGENGAGKSTLMKILAGIQGPDEGQILIDGDPVAINSVNDALGLGISLIHQELNLADNLDVGANIYLGREPMKLGFINFGKIHRQSKRFLDQVGLDVKSTEKVSSLTIGRQQMVEIAKALSVDARVLIMDEPTSSLSAHETEALFKVVHQLRDQGVSVIYISHRLGEVKELADRVVVLRDGENAGVLDRHQIDHDAMVQLMIGRDISKFYARTAHKLGDPILQVNKLVTQNWPLHPLSFSVRAGEIVGVAGLVGAGRTEMLRSIFGVDQRLGGSVSVNGSELAPGDPVNAISKGLALVPEDRKLHGLIVEMNLRSNIGLSGLRRNQRRFGFRNDRIERKDSSEMIRKLRIKTPNDLQISQYLSGGNQQKVVLGKWLALEPHVLLLDEPTRGIDIGAKQEIYQLMEQLAADGKSVLFVSSELEEILGMSDRVVVMHEGRITGELQRDELTEEAVMQLATGRVKVARR